MSEDSGKEQRSATTIANPPPLISNKRVVSSSSLSASASQRYIVVQQGAAVQPSAQGTLYTVPSTHSATSKHTTSAFHTIQNPLILAPFEPAPQPQTHAQYVQVAGIGPILLPQQYAPSGHFLFPPSIHQVTSKNIPTHFSPQSSDTHSPASSDSLRVDSPSSAKDDGKMPFFDYEMQSKERSRSGSLSLVQRASLLKHRRSLPSSEISGGLVKRALSEKESVDQAHSSKGSPNTGRSSLEKLLLSNPNNLTSSSKDSSTSKRDTSMSDLADEPHLLHFYRLFQTSVRSSHLRIRMLTTEGAQSVLKWMEVTRKASYIDPSFGPIDAARIIISSNGLCKLQLIYPYMKTVYTKFIPSTQAEANEILNDLSPEHVLCPGLSDCQNKLDTLGYHPTSLRILETPHFKRYDHERCAVWHIPMPSSAFSESGLILHHMCNHCKGLRATIMRTASNISKYNLNAQVKHQSTETASTSEPLSSSYLPLTWQYASTSEHSSTSTFQSLQPSHHIMGTTVLERAESVEAHKIKGYKIQRKRRERKTARDEAAKEKETASVIVLAQGSCTQTSNIHYYSSPLSSTSEACETSATPPSQRKSATARGKMRRRSSFTDSDSSSQLVISSSAGSNSSKKRKVSSCSSDMDD